jgi:tellurite resistance protein TehA-like permease
MTTNRRALLLQKLVHTLTALVLTLKALAKLEHPHGLWPAIVFFLVSSIWILAITILHDHLHNRLHTHTRFLTASVYAIECIATAIVAALYFAEGKHALPWVTTLGSIGFAIALIVHLRQTRPGNGRHGEGVTGA